MNSSEYLHENVHQAINLDNLYSALVECFSVILCGYAAGRLNLISQRETRGLDVFVRTFSLPSVIFLSLAQLDMSSVNWYFLASILVSKSIVFIGVMIVTVCLSRPVHLGKLGLYAVFCTQSNDFALGYPILNALYGKEHPDYPSYVYLLAPISLAVLNPIAYIFLEIGKFQRDQDPDKKPVNLVQENGIVEQSEAHASNLDTSEEITIDRSVSGHGEENLPNPPQNARKFGLKLCGTVLFNVVTNPVMLMTFLGIVGNFVYRYIEFVGVVLKAFATVFSTTALFVLGLRMVGTVHKLKGSVLVTPAILIIIKLLVLPLITREVVSILRPGVNSSDTLNLSTFGFMYGTFPTAPMVFVLSTQYDLELDIMSSSLVVCTFLSAPLMYISARMIFMDFVPTDDYLKKLESFGFNIGVIGIPLAVWLVILFIVNKSFTKIPHKISGFLFLSQVVICIGVALQPLTNNNKPWLNYIQFSVFAFGLYSSRLWTFFLAVTLVLLQSRSLCFVIKLMPVFMCLAWGVPVLVVTMVCLASFPKYSFGSLMNPDFNREIFQSVTTLLLLIFSFVGTSVCLILQHRYQRRFAKYMVLVQEVNSKDLREVNETVIGENSTSINNTSCQPSKHRIVTDIEEIVSENDLNVCSGNCEGEGLCSSKFDCTDTQRELCEETLKQYNDETINEDIGEDRQDLQVLRHIVLLLLLVTSMFVNLMLSIWTLVVEDAISGVYIELLFLNVMLNTGQIFLTFSVFGFETRSLIISLTNSSKACVFLNYLSNRSVNNVKIYGYQLREFLRLRKYGSMYTVNDKKMRWRKFYYGADTIVLTPVDQLGFETTHVCHQFIAHHLHDCRKEIVKNKRLRLRMYKDCFKGKTLVSWLQTQRLAKDEAEAVQYASHLLEGRVLRHVENRYYFENSDLLYTFKQ